MPLIVQDNITSLIFLLMGAFLITTPPIFIALHILMPKKFLGKYFSPDFFQTWELNTFSHFPSSFMRTVMLTSVIAFPSLGKKRNMSHAYSDVQPWYRLFAKTYWIYFFSLWTGMVALLFGLFFYIIVTSN